PLIEAIAKGNYSAAQTLLERGAPPSAVYMNKDPAEQGFQGLSTTPLRVAIMSGSPAMVDLILSAGAEVNALHSKSMTPLHLAA
ncbi:unnamed protein product, partial [Pelagomonas calceolata]